MRTDLCVLTLHASSLLACAGGSVLAASDVRIVDNAPAFACLSLGVVVADVPAAGALDEPRAREASIVALRGELASQGADTGIYDGFERRGDTLRARGRGFVCVSPPPPPAGL